MTDPTFRDFTGDDLEVIVDLVVRCDALVGSWAPPGWSLPADWSESELRVWERDLADPALWREVACDRAGTVVGVAVTEVDEDGGAAGAGNLISLFVEPRLHGRGIGGRLLARAERWIEEQGCGRATVTALAGAPAVGFYLAHGFSPDGHRGTYEPFDLPTVGLEKRL